MHIPDVISGPATLRDALHRFRAVPVDPLRRLKPWIEHPACARLFVLPRFVHHHDVQTFPSGRHHGSRSALGIAAIVLGPWASISAISMALIITGLSVWRPRITPLAPTVSLMAILGSLTAVRDLPAYIRPFAIESPRRVMAPRSPVTSQST